VESIGAHTATERFSWRALAPARGRRWSASPGERWTPVRGWRWSAPSSPGVRRPPERALRRTRTFHTHRTSTGEHAPSASGCSPATPSREEAVGWGCGGGSKWQIERGWIERGGSSEENEGVRRIDLSRVSSKE
jgi:hypothetical protein